jgi:hypothetical protein
MTRQFLKVAAASAMLALTAASTPARADNTNPRSCRYESGNRLQMSMLNVKNAKRPRTLLNPGPLAFSRPAPAGLVLCSESAWESLPKGAKAGSAVSRTPWSGIVRANSFTLPKCQNQILRPLIFLHFSGSI